MNKKNFILYEWNAKTKEFWFLGEKIDYVHNPSEWRKYLNNLVTEKQHLEHNWNELKKWLEEIHVRWENWYTNDLSIHDRRYYEKEYNYKRSAYEDVLDKIKKLEEGGNNEC